MTTYTIASLQSRYVAIAAPRCITATLGILFICRILRLDLIAESAPMIGGLLTIFVLEKDLKNNKPRIVTQQEITSFQQAFRRQAYYVLLHYAFIGGFVFLGEIASAKHNYMGGFLMAALVLLPYATCFRVHVQPIEITNSTGS